MTETLLCSRLGQRALACGYQLTLAMAVLMGKTVNANAINPLDTFESSADAMILLTVDKGSLRADLRTLKAPFDPSELLHSFRIAIGKEQGDKQREGDNRTPEGIYFTLPHIITEKLLPTKYGPRAIPLKFPNPIDHRDGKTGYGIWLHGAGNDNRIASAQITEGCVAFYNADITKLKTWLQPNQGVVVIAQDVTTVNRPEDVQGVNAATQAWINAWKQRSADAYIKLYHTNFAAAGRNLSAYASYKKRVFASYREIDLKMTNVRIVTHPKYSVTIMNQDFSGDQRFHSRGRKILYWEKAIDGWKIIRELFDQKRFEPLLYSKADITRLQSSIYSQTAGVH